MKQKQCLAGLSVILACAAIEAPAAAETLPARTPLRSIDLPAPKAVARVETARMDFKPGERMPAHRHPVPVICFVTKGNLLVRIGDAPEEKVPTGAVTYEPAGAVTHYFRNASSSEPAQIACATLAGAGENTARVMLDEK